MPCPATPGGSTSATPTGTAGNPNPAIVSTQGVTGGTPIGISAAALPLPTGAATASGVAAVVSTLGTPFQSGGSIGNASFGATQSGSWTVGISGSPSVSVTNLPTTQPVSGSVSVTSLPPLSAGTNAIGSVTVSNLPATQPVSGTVAATQSGAWTLAAGSSAIGTVGVTSLPALAAGSATIGAVNVNGTVPVSGAFYPATQPISATSLPLPSGAAADSTLAAASAKLPTSLGAKASAASLSITPATDASFAVTGSFYQATQPVSVASLPLPSGAATDATASSLFKAGQSIGNTAFGISGQLPAFSSTPTFNLGTAPILTISNTAFASTVAAGANVAEGAPADAAYMGSGNASIVAALKGVYAATLAPLASGTNTIGSIANTGFASTVASGADVTEGTAADAAYAGTGNATTIAALKGIYAQLGGPSGNQGAPYDDVVSRAGVGYVASTGTQSVAAGNYLNVVFTCRSDKYCVLFTRRFSTTQYVSYQTRSGATQLSGATTATSSNKLQGGAATTSSFTFQMGTAALSTGSAGTQEQAFANAERVLADVRVIPPGASYGIAFGGAGGGLGAAATIAILFEWYERAAL